MVLFLTACFISEADYAERVDLDGDGALPPIAGGADCDNDDASVGPGAVELCNGVDDDCDGVIDNDAVDAVAFFLDRDGDGHGDADKPRSGCSIPEDGAEVGDDCDDDNSQRSPSRKEVCDFVDNDCDDDVDEGFDESTWFEDADVDGWGNAASTVQACAGPSGFVSVAEDCDDTDDAINPDASEVFYDGVDQDCDEASDFDADGDGFDAGAHGGLDCDDDLAAANPDADEVFYDGTDQDCDGANDFDADGDTYVDAAWSSQAGGTAPNTDDCDDADDGVHPAAVESWYDGTDQDCDGANDFDADADGFVVVGSEIEAGGTAPGVGDCDDDSDLVNPDAPEINDGVDNDCNGFDETYDTDGDGLTDAEENIGGTDYLLSDTDGGGANDGVEVSEGLDPNDDDDDDVYIRLASNPLSRTVCALRADGSFTCWGDSIGGVEPSEPLASLAVGDGEACGVGLDGTLSCWGSSPLVPPGGSHIDVAVGFDFACSVDDTSGLQCWGADNLGQSSPPIGTWSKVDLGLGFGCGIDSAGAVLCWGNNDEGQANPPAGSFEAVGLGASHACGIDAASSLSCWGAGGLDRLNAPPGTFLRVDAGETHACAISDVDGAVSCWGDATDNKLVAPPGSFRELAAGRNNTCALAMDRRTLSCWGANLAGESTPP